MKTILVVDDELAIAEMLQAFLDGEGFNVEMASNGQEALDRLAQSPADLVISDLMMPHIDGRGLARALRHASPAPAIPIVVMSALGEKLVGDDVHYDGFLRKPFHLEEVLELITRLIGTPDH
jgi:CheY-like chemotaxis protein